MDRKAQTISFEMLMWIPRLVYLVIVIIATSGIILAFIVTNVSVGDVESHILLHRLQFSPEGIVKYDSETRRVYPGIVDVSRLSSNRLESALNAGKKEVAARFKLVGLQDESELATAYLHEGTYKDWQPIAVVVAADKDIRGSGRKLPHSEERYVYYSRPSRLETVVITQNE